MLNTASGTGNFFGSPHAGKRTSNARNLKGFEIANGHLSIFHSLNRLGCGVLVVLRVLA